MKFLKIYTSLELLVVMLNVTAALQGTIRLHGGQEGSKVRFRWTIKNLHLSDFVHGEAIFSSRLSSGSNNTDCLWFFTFNPKGSDTANPDYVSVYIHTVSCNISAIVTLGFINSNNAEVNKKQFFHTFDEKHTNLGYREFAKQDLFTNPENGLLVNDSLIIFCDVQATSSDSEV